jgi:hypothetical protein
MEARQRALLQFVLPSVGSFLLQEASVDPVDARAVLGVLWTRAAAAMRASRSEQGSGTCNRAQRNATAASTDKIRPENRVSTWPSIQARRTALCLASFRSISSVPSSNSSNVIDEMKMLATGTLAAHAKVSKEVHCQRWLAEQLRLRARGA